MINITTTGGGEGGLGVNGRGQRPPWKGGEQDTALKKISAIVVKIYIDSDNEILI